MYQKLFPISYNNKRFMLFLDENNKNVFLEINEVGEYVYSSLQDYVELYKIFNIRNPFICNQIGKVSFKNRVKVIKNGILSFLAVVTIINSVPHAQALDIKVETSDTSVTISEEQVEEISEILSEAIQDYNKKNKYLDNVKDLDLYLGKVNVTKELILDAIDKNNKMLEDMKEIAKKGLEAKIKTSPESNLRVFYENVKSLDVKVYTDEEYREAFPSIPGAEAHYDVKTNTIHIRNTSNDVTKYHELYHTYHQLYRKIGDINIYRIEEKHNAFDEGITEKMVDLISPSNVKGAYKLSKQILEFFMDYAGFTYKEYDEYNLDYLFRKAKKLYPDLDFNYISETLNAMKSAEICQSEVMVIDDAYDMFDELFKICLRNASLENGYKPFSKFIRILSDSKNNDLKYSYLGKYNVKLQELGYKNIISVAKVKRDMQRFSICNGVNININTDLKVTPIHYKGESIYYINEDGTATIKVEHPFYYCHDSISNIILNNYLENLENFNSDNFWKQVALDIGLVPCLLGEIPIYINGNFISNEIIPRLCLQVGVTKDNHIGFILTKNGQIVYQSSEEMYNISAPKPFLWYINFDNINIINLEKYLNEEYLIDSLNNRGNLFENVIVEDNQLIFLPPIQALTASKTVESVISKDVDGEYKRVRR